MIRLQITKTSRSYSPNQGWSIFDNSSKTFENIQQAKDWLKETYGNSKRKKMFIDVKGESKQVGYIIGFRVDYGIKYIQQDWVEFQEIKQTFL